MVHGCPMATETKQPLPPQVPFIIGNEACERFSFYGMRNILTQFLIGYLLLTGGVRLVEWVAAPVKGKR